MPCCASTLFVSAALVAPTLAFAQTARPHVSAKPVIVDVRMAGDCDALPPMRRTAVKIGFDLNDDTSAARELSDAMFLDEIRRNSVLTIARRAKTSILVVCCQGLRATHAAKLLVQYGYNATVLDHGLQGRKSN